MIATPVISPTCHVLAQSPSIGQRLDALIAQNIEPTWLIIGITAQVLIAACFISHLIASTRRGWFILPPVIVHTCLLATLVLLAYAGHRGDLVFFTGQFLNILICIRLEFYIHGRHQKAAKEEAHKFPNVAPDSAERHKAADHDHG